MPRGGRRPGAGRKPKPRLLTMPGLPTHVATPMVPPTTNYPLPLVEEFDAPDSLTKEERDVWLKQAPHAFRNRTLTKATALAFERYCRMVAQEQVEAKSSALNGANHRGLRREINTLELQFLLTPCGRPLLDPSETAGQPVGKLARFRT